MGLSRFRFVPHLSPKRQSRVGSSLIVDRYGAVELLTLFALTGVPVVLLFGWLTGGTGSDTTHALLEPFEVSTVQVSDALYAANTSTCAPVGRLASSTTDPHFLSVIIPIRSRGLFS